MSESFSTPNVRERIDAIAHRFAVAWEHGEQPRLEPLLDQFPESPDELLERLLPIELRARQRLGNPLGRDECRERFPRFQLVVDRLFLDPTCDSVPEVRHDASTDDRPVPVTAVASDPQDTDPFSLHTDDLATTELLPHAAFPQIDGFEILGELGRGGMGVVYRAFEIKHQRTVALKTMLRVDPASVSRFKQEFRARAGVHHHNLVRLYGLVVNNRLSYFTMELVEGRDILRTLRGDLAPGKPLPEERLDSLADALRQICDGLMALHAGGKVHRDIKSSNILMTDEGRVVIVDFGLAIALGHDGDYQTIDGHVIGTPTYMSPEQAAGSAVTPATDCYALGVLLYAALTGRLPFEGRTAEVIRRKCVEDPMPPDDRVAGIPAHFSHICTRLLTRDPETRADVRWVLNELGAPQLSAAAPQSDQPFVGRETELQALLAGFRRLRERQPSSHFLRGLSGSGKSKLVSRLIEEVWSHPDVLVLQSRCYGQESIPFKAIDELIEGLTRHLRELTFEQVDALLPRNVDALAQVFPTLRQVDAVRQTPRSAEGHPDRQSLRNKAFLALREMLARIGDRRRLLLIIDDLQWSDDDSLVLLNHLLRGPDPPNLMFVGIFREEEFREAVFEAVTKSVPSCHRLELGPLSLSDCERLFDSIMPPGDDPRQYAALRSKIASESLGSPLFLRELVLAVTEGGQSLAAMGDVTLDGIMWSRIENLPETPQRVLVTLATAGQPMALADLSGITEISIAEVTDSVESLFGQSLAREVGGDEDISLDTFHDRVREVILARLSETDRRGYNRSIAEYRESRGEADASFLARHFRLAGDSEKSARYCAIAADDATDKLAFHQAAELYGEALELHQKIPHDDSENDLELKVKFADALSNSGQCLQAAEVYLDAAEKCDGPMSLEMRRRAFSQFQFLGQIKRARDVLHVLGNQIGRQVPKTIPQAALLTLVANVQWMLTRRRRVGSSDPSTIGHVDAFWSVASAMTHVDFVRGSYYTARHLLEAEKLGDPPRLARALALESGMTSALGRVTLGRSRRIAKRAESILQGCDDPFVDSVVHLCGGIRAGCLGEWTSALRESQHAEHGFVALSRSTAIRDSSELHLIAGSLAVAQFWQLMAFSWLGDLAELRDRCDPLITEAVQRRDLFTSAMLGAYSRSYLRAADDHPEAGLEELAETLRDWNDGGFYIQHHLAVVGEATLLLYQGDGEQAFHRIRGYRRKYRESWFLAAHLIRAQLNEILTRCALSAAARDPGDRKWLREANRARRRLCYEMLPWTSALATAYRGAIHLFRNRPDRAAHDFATAGERLDAMGMTLHAAACRIRLAEITGADRERTDALSQMTNRGVARPDKFLRFLAPAPSDGSPPNETHSTKRVSDTFSPNRGL